MNNYSSLMIHVRVFSNVYLECHPNREILKTVPKIAMYWGRAERSFPYLLMLEMLA